MNQRAKKAAVWITILTAVIVAGSFMPWAEIPASEMRFSGMPGMPTGMFDSGPFGGMSMTFTVTGWNGSITLASMKLPNWTTVMLACVLTAIAWLSATNAAQTPKLLAPFLALLGLLQAAATIFVLIGSAKATVGIGLLLTAASFLGMVIASFGLPKQPRGDVAVA